MYIFEKSKPYTLWYMRDIYCVCFVFAGGWSGKIAALDISGGRSCSRGAHPGVWQSLWKGLVLQHCVLTDVLQKALEHKFCRILYAMWNSYSYSRGHQTWSTAVVFGSCLWAGGAQSTGPARWRWWGSVSRNCTHFYFHSLCFDNICTLVHTIFVYFIRWFSRIHRSKENCPGSQCKCVVQCGDEGWWDEITSLVTCNISLCYLINLMWPFVSLSDRSQSGVWSDEQFGGLQTQQPTHLPRSTSQ